MAYITAKYCKKKKVKLIVDVQDLWPEAFNMVLPFGKLNTLLTYPLKCKADRVYKSADQVITVSETYKRRIQKVVQIVPVNVVYLGIQMEQYEISEKNSQNFSEHISNANKITIGYCGTLGHSYDLKCVMDAISNLKVNENVYFLIMGDGPLRKEFEKYAKEKQEMLDTIFYKQVTDSKITDAIQTATDEAKKDGGFYRTVQLGTDDENAANLNRVWNTDQYISSIYSSSYNKAYQNFRKDTFGLEQPYRNFLMQSEESNPIYARFMGEKYIVTKSKMKGVRLLGKSGEWKIYENESAASIIYGTSQVMSEKNYDKLDYPYNQTTLLQKAVVPESATKQTDSIEAVDNLHNAVLRFGENSCISEADGGYHIFARKDTKVKAEIVSQIDINSANTVNTENAGENTNVANETKTDSGNRVLLLRFKVKNLKPSKDLTIWVDGNRNKLSAKQRVYYNDNTTFTYAVALEGDENQVEVTFSKGKYNLSDVEAYIATLPGTELYESEFLQNSTKTKGNVIAGNLTMQKSGYLITSIPYDSGFKIQVDGKNVKSEKVNTAFLGCKMKAGEHDIVITYHAPGMAAGKVMSFVGMMGFLILSVLEHVDTKK